MTPPNILWISTHDINPDLGCYAGIWPGAEYAVTPNLDRLAGDGARFDLAFAAAPVCAPARSAIMTGCFPTSIGTMHMRTKAVPPPEVKLLPEYFRQAGYYCTNNWFTDFQVDTPPTVFDDCSPSAHWRNRPDPEMPFFAAFHGMGTHESNIYLDDLAFADATKDLRDSDRHDPDVAPLPPYYPDTPAFRCSWARYSDLITQMDHWVGGILDQLEEDGLAGDTIVVFWSDHGRGMPRAKRWPTEAGLREPLIIRWPGRIAPGTRVEVPVHTMDLAPTMLQACGLPVPTHMHGVPLVHQDGTVAVPTADPPYVYAGRDRMDEAEDTSRTVRDPRYRYVRNYHPDRPPMMHIEYPDKTLLWNELRKLAAEEARQLAMGGHRSLLTEPQRRLVDAAKPPEELYDLESDPHELRNLANDTEHTATLARMRRALNDWQERYGDLGLLPEDELLASWRPNGKTRTTSPPHIDYTDGHLEASCPTAGASIGWTMDKPRQAEDLQPAARILGSPVQDGRQWNLYTQPLLPDTTETLWFRAWRLGYSPSSDVEVAAR
ncbi:Arylsulfatase A [Arthrobacter sp. 31Cvi3.1E]|nr:Arylsulfatase A [Arthrobacter sp. 31Cvi3.1E]